MFPWKLGGLPFGYKERLKRVKMEEKLLSEPIGTHQCSFERYHPDPLYGLPFLEIGGLQLATPSYLRTAKATDFKFGGYIYRANPNKRSLQILEKRARGCIQ